MILSYCKNDEYSFKIIENNDIFFLNIYNGVNGILIDKLYNFYLTMNSYRRKFFRVEHQKKLKPKNVSHLIFFDEFRRFDDTSWSIGQPWGKFHPDALYQYYGNIEDGIIESSHEGLKLHQKYKPKNFSYQEKDITIPYSVGLIVSKKSFGYGYYQCDATLPKGKNLWPAIWLSDHKSWPPEIDILEAYSDASGRYKDRLETNIHYGIKDVNKTSSDSHKHPLAHNISESHRYAVLWSVDKIEFYYDGFLVRRVTNKKVLEWFNKSDIKMTWILNNAIRQDSDINNLQDSVFIIHNVKVYSLKQ